MIKPEITLDEFVRQFVDNQIGLDNATYCVWNHHSQIDNEINIRSKGSMSVEEWREMAAELVDLLERNEYGKWVLYSVSRKHCELDLENEESN